MLNENAKKWVEALRSGRYVKGVWGLKYEMAGLVYHCALGVACEVAKQNGVELREAKDAQGFTYFDGEDEFLPKKVQEWLGLRSPRGACCPLYEDNIPSIMEMNDYEGLSLSAIAYQIDCWSDGFFNF